MTTASPRLHRLVAAFDRGLLQLAPAWAASRAQSRVKAVAYRQAYEAAEKTHLRQASRDFGSGNTIVTMTGVALRNQARHLDRNHDIISGGLSTLVQNIIGPSGINIVPTPATSTATWLNHWWMPSSPLPRLVQTSRSHLDARLAQRPAPNWTAGNTPQATKCVAWCCAVSMNAPCAKEGPRDDLSPFLLIVALLLWISRRSSHSQQDCHR